MPRAIRRWRRCCSPLGAGLVVMGRDSAYVAVERNARGFAIVRSVGRDVDTGGADADVRDPSGSEAVLPVGIATLRATFTAGGRVRFRVDPGEAKSVDASPEFVARPGVWVGARVGLFAFAPGDPNVRGPARGYADVDWFRVEPIEKEHIR